MDVREASSMQVYVTTVVPMGKKSKGSALLVNIRPELEASAQVGNDQVTPESPEEPSSTNRRISAGRPVHIGGVVSTVTKNKENLTILDYCP